MSERFTRFAQLCARGAGSPWAFMAACVVVIAWLVSGPLFGFSDTWQLVINTGTTIITNLLAFLVLNTQTRDTAALMLKLDEIIKALPQARNQIINAENMTEAELLGRLEELRQLSHPAHHE